MARLGKGDGWLRGLPPVFQRLCATAVAYNVIDPTVGADAAVFARDFDLARDACRKLERASAHAHATEGLWRCFDVLNYDRCSDARARRAAACHFLRAAAEGPGRRHLLEAALRVGAQKEV